MRRFLILWICLVAIISAIIGTILLICVCPLLGIVVSCGLFAAYWRWIESLD